MMAVAVQDLAQTRWMPPPVPQTDPAADKGHFWLTCEQAVLAKLWDGGLGIEEVERALPHKSRTAIEQQATEMGLPRVGGPLPGGFRTNDRIDTRIKEVYGQGPWGAVNKLAAELGVPGWWISRRAGQLGLTRQRLKAPDYSDAELGILRRCAGSGAARAQQELAKAGFTRSVGAVASKLKELAVRNEDCDVLSARSLATCMGVDEKTIVRWITRADLKASRAGAGWRINVTDLRTWVITHPRLVDLRRVDGVWFIDMLGGTRPGRKEPDA